MKKLILLFIVCNLLLSFESNASFVPSRINQQQILISCLSNNLSAKQYQKLLGRRLTLSERADYFLLKHHLKKIENNDDEGFSAGGFILGLLTGPVGVAIAYLASKNKRFRKGAVTGFVVLIGLGILSALLLVTIIGKF